MEIGSVVGILLERLPDLRLATNAQIREGRNPILSTIEEMPVELTPRPVE